MFMCNILLSVYDTRPCFFQSDVCSVSAILEQREDGLVEIARTVRALVEAAARPKQSAV